MNVSKIPCSAIVGGIAAIALSACGDATTLRLDTRTEHLVADSIGIAWNASWIGGDANATVSISDNGVEVKRLIGAGEFTHTIVRAGRHELTYTTYIGGVAQAQVFRAVVFKDWKYEVAGGKATITGTTLKSGTVSVPAEIDGYPVTAIGNSVFGDCGGLTSVAIPSSVTGIGDGAFQGCNNIATLAIPGHFRMNEIFPHPEKITNLTIASGTTAIIDDAFRNCYNVKAVVIPDSVKSIGASAFEDCKGVVSMKIGKGVESIADGAVFGRYSYGTLQGYDTCAAFARNYTLTAFEVDSQNSHFAAINGVLYTKDGRELVAFPAGCGGEYAIPYGVEKIWAGAFCGAFDLNSLMIPDTVTGIGDGVFSDCENLRNVYLPARFKDHKRAFFAAIDLSSCSYCTFTYSRPVARTLALDGQGGVTETTTVNPSYCYAMPTVAVPTRAGYTFDGYYSEPNGGGTQYYNADGTSTRTWDSTTVTTLYAKWTKNSGGDGGDANGGAIDDGQSGTGGATAVPEQTYPDYSVAFAANSGKGKMDAQTFKYGVAAKLNKNVFTKKGYVFAGWAVSKDDAKKGVIAYENTQEVRSLRADGGTTTLYAVWAKQTYKVAFYGTYKGVSGTMAAQSMKYGKKAKLKANKFKRKGYTFKGWATSKANAKKGKVKYKNKAKVKNLTITGKTVKLYAVWKKK